VHNKKDYCILEICNKTIKDLKKEKTNSKVLKMLKNNPLLLHKEFERYLKTKYKPILSHILDKYWHNFMLFSNEYNSWCIDNFGYLINRAPAKYFDNKSLQHIEYFKDYRKKYPLTKSILLYNLPYKMIDNKINFRKIKKTIIDLTSENISQKTNRIIKFNKKVHKKLSQKGYCVLKNKLTLDEYNSLNNTLGSIANTTNIVININGGRKLNSHEAMPLHTDAHDADIIGWFCQEQDSKDGQIILKDLRDYKEYFTENEVKELKKIKIKNPIYKTFYAGTHSLLKHKKFYYVPWLEETDYSKKQKVVLEKFKKFIKEKKNILVDLKKGDILYIDNSFMIHGRDIIDKNSNRLLYRVHIMR